MESTADQINTLSSGTIASITGVREYEVIDQIRNEWWAWAYHHKLDIRWQDAWKLYVEERKPFYITYVEKSHNLIAAYNRELQKPLTESERSTLQSSIDQRQNQIKWAQSRLEIFSLV